MRWRQEGSSRWLRGVCAVGRGGGAGQCWGSWPGAFVAGDGAGARGGRTSRPGSCTSLVSCVSTRRKTPQPGSAHGQTQAQRARGLALLQQALEVSGTGCEPNRNLTWIPAPPSSTTVTAGTRDLHPPHPLPGPVGQGTVLLFVWVSFSLCGFMRNMQMQTVASNF